MGILHEIQWNTRLALKPVRDRYNRSVLEQGYDPNKDRPEYPLATFDEHSALAREARGQISGDVLEIGPGGNLGVALLFLAAGASSATCIDIFPWGGEDLPLYHQLVDNPASYFDRITYRAPEAIETTSLPDESFDIIYSQACMEHVYDPSLTVSRLARLLRPGGVTSHQIDLRDHRDFARPLEFLRYPDWVWRAAHSRNVYTNRWRRSDWIAAFEREGLEVTCARSTLNWPVTEELRAGFRPRFRGKDLDDLASLGLLIAAVKR